MISPYFHSRAIRLPVGYRRHLSPASRSDQQSSSGARSSYSKRTAAITGRSPGYGVTHGWRTWANWNRQGLNDSLTITGYPAGASAQRICGRSEHTNFPHTGRMSSHTVREEGRKVSVRVDLSMIASSSLGRQDEVERPAALVSTPQRSSHPWPHRPSMAGCQGLRMKSARQ
jgi:hypothetical protein